MTRDGARLTEAEARVCFLKALGLLDKQISHRLGVTVHTVKAHVYSARVRLGLVGMGRGALTVWWIANAAQHERDAVMTFWRKSDATVGGIDQGDSAEGSAGGSEAGLISAALMGQSYTEPARSNVLSW